MRILTKKQMDDILKRITANEIIGMECIGDVDCYTQFVENNADIAFTIGGEKGANKIRNTVSKYIEKKY